MAAHHADADPSPLGPQLSEMHSVDDKGKIAPVYMNDTVFQDVFHGVANDSPEAIAGISIDDNTWSSEKTGHLIEVYREMRGNFDIPGVPKKVGWRLVAEKMQTLGHEVTAHQCSTKWRSLRFRYRAVKEKRRSKGGPVRWSPFNSLVDLMEEELNHTVTSSQSKGSGNATSHMGDRASFETLHDVEESQDEEIMQLTNPNGDEEDLEESGEAGAVKEATTLQESPGTRLAGSQSLLQSVSPSLLDSSSGSNVWWNHKHVRVLIDLYRELRKQYGDAGFKKKEIWNAVAKRMNALGINYSGVQCDVKWRNLKYRFKVARERVMQTGQQPKWVFYKVFEEMAKEDPSVIIPSVLDSLCDNSSAPSPVPSVRMVASMPTVYITRPVPTVRPIAKKSVPVTMVPPPKRIPPGPFPTALVSNQAVRPGARLGRPPNPNRPQYSTSPALSRTPGTRGLGADKQKDKKSSANGVQFSAAGAASQNASMSVGDSVGQGEVRALANGLAAIGDLQKQVAAVAEEQRTANSLRQEQNQLLRDLNDLIRQALDKMTK